MRLFRNIPKALPYATRFRSIGSPWKRICPSLGSINPVIILIVVDFPEPFGPR